MLASLESLESRRLLSVTLEAGVLTIVGAETPDRIRVGRNETMILVDDNGTSSSWNPADVQSIDVSTLGGNDEIAILRGVFKPIQIDAGAGDDKVHGGTGRERILGGAGMDLLVGGGGGDHMEGGDDDDRIVGGAGEDHMFGNAGSDRFDAVDHNVDRIDGGDGEDFARVSRGDRAINVEHVQVVRPGAAGSTDLRLIDDDLGDVLA